MAAAPATPPPVPGDASERQRIREIRDVQDQIYVFLEKNPAVESTAPLEAAWDEIRRPRSLNKAFERAIRGGLLTMDKALRFALYMKTDVEPLLDELDPPLPVARRPTPFRADEALIFISRFYDTGVDDLAGPTEESDSETDESSGESDGALEEGDEDAPDSEGSGAAGLD
jgi:hypothetical protein